MYKKELIQEIKKEYKEEVEINKNILGAMDFIHDYLEDFRALEEISDLSKLKIDVSNHKLDINGQYLEFEKTKLGFKVNITSIQNDSAVTIDEFTYKDGAFINSESNLLSNEVMDDYLKKAFKGKWNKNPEPSLKK